MFKPILRTLPSLSGNFKLACYVDPSNIYKNKKDNDINVNYIYVTHGDLSPLLIDSDESYKFKKRIPLSFSSTLGLEYDIKKYYKNYSDSFYEMSNLETYKPNSWLDYVDSNDNINMKSSRDKSFEYGMTNMKNATSIKIDNLYYNKSYYAPIYIDNVDEIPGYFCLSFFVEEQNKQKCIKKVMIDLVNKTKTKNYFGKYLFDYVQKINPKVIYCNYTNGYATYDGINVEAGGLVVKKDNDFKYVYNNLMTQNMFDYYISQGFKRNHMIMKQVIPISFEFNLYGLLGKELTNKYIYRPIKVIGQYMYNQNKYVNDIYDFSHNYKEFMPYHKEYITNKHRIGHFKKKYDVNVLDQGFPSFYESKYIRYKYTNECGKVNYCRYKLLNSTDKRPYIMNLSWGYTALSHKYTLKYGETPTYSIPENGIPIFYNDRRSNTISELIENNLNDTYRYDNFYNRDKYDFLQSNFISEWFENDPALTFTTLDKNIFENNMKVLYRGYLYDLSALSKDSYIMDLLHNSKKVKFGITVTPNINSSNTYESLSNNIVYENGYVLRNKKIENETTNDNLYDYTVQLDNKSKKYKNILLNYSSIINNFSEVLYDKNCNDNIFKVNESDSLDFTTKMYYNDSKKFKKHIIGNTYEESYEKIKQSQSSEELYENLNIDNIENVYCEISNLTDLRGYSNLSLPVNTTLLRKDLDELSNLYFDVDEIIRNVKGVSITSESSPNITIETLPKAITDEFINNFLYDYIIIGKNQNKRFISKSEYLLSINEYINSSHVDPLTENQLEMFNMLKENAYTYSIYTYDIVHNSFNNHIPGEINNQEDTHIVYFDSHNLQSLLQVQGFNADAYLSYKSFKKTKLVPFLNKQHIIEYCKTLNKDENYDDNFDINDFYVLYTDNKSDTLKLVSLEDLGITSAARLKQYVSNGSDSYLFNINVNLDLDIKRDVVIINNSFDINTTSSGIVLYPDKNRSSINVATTKEQIISNQFSSSEKSSRTILDNLYNINSSNNTTSTVTLNTEEDNELTNIKINNSFELNNISLTKDKQQIDKIDNSLFTVKDIALSNVKIDNEVLKQHNWGKFAIEDKTELEKTNKIMYAFTNAMILCKRDLYELNKKSYNDLVKNVPITNKETLYLFTLLPKDITFIEKYLNNVFETQVKNYSELVKNKIIDSDYTMYDICMPLFNNVYIKNMYSAYDNDLIRLLNSNIISYNEYKDRFTVIENKERIFVPLYDLVSNLESYIINEMLSNLGENEIINDYDLTFTVFNKLKMFILSIIDKLYDEYENVSFSIGKSNNEDTSIYAYTENNILYLKYDLLLNLDNTSYTFNSDKKLITIYDNIKDIVSSNVNAIKYLIPFVKDDIVKKYCGLMKNYTLTYPSNVFMNVNKKASKSLSGIYDINMASNVNKKIRFIRYFDYITPYLENINERYNDDSIHNASFITYFYSDNRKVDRDILDNSNLYRRNINVFRYEPDLYIYDNIFALVQQFSEKDAVNINEEKINDSITNMKNVVYDKNRYIDSIYQNTDKINYTSQKTIESTLMSQIALKAVANKKAKYIMNDIVLNESLFSAKSLTNKSHKLSLSYDKDVINDAITSAIINDELSMNTEIVNDDDNQIDISVLTNNDRINSAVRDAIVNNSSIYKVDKNDLGIIIEYNKSYISANISSTERKIKEYIINKNMTMNKLSSLNKLQKTFVSVWNKMIINEIYCYNHKWYFDNESIIMIPEIIFENVDLFNNDLNEKIDLSINLNLKTKTLELFKSYILQNQKLSYNISKMYGKDINSKILFLLNCYNIKYEVIYDIDKSLEITNIIMSLK